MGASTFLRDTPLGQGIRFVSRSRLLQYPEERHDFKLPDSFPPAVLEASADASCPEPPFHDREKGGTRGTTPEDASSPGSQSPLPRSDRRPDEPILVGWYGPDDPENPRNWSWRRKLYVHLSINIYTFGVYMASSIFTPVIPEVIRIYGIDRVTASLGIGLYTLGYGLGPLALSPPSEIAAVGRNPVYVATMVVFVLLSVGAALVDNVPGLMVLRFLQGFFCAPGLANGGGSIGDVTSPLLLPYALYLWAFFPLGGPSLGPMIAGFSVAAENWRWALWEIVWIASFSLVNLILLPETSASNILYRRAARLRALTGNPAYRSRAEITQQHLSAGTIARDSLLIPWKINALDPSVLFTSLYCGLVYGAFYTFFEVFPLVFVDVYGMNYGEMGMIFLSVLVAVVVVGVPYLTFLHVVVDPAVRDGLHLEPEVRLIPGVAASFLMPTGLFLFAWTANSGFHWIVPTVGVLFASGGMCLIIQSIYVYLALAYPDYAASLIGANTFCRGAVAFGAVLWSTPLFDALGVARGTSLLGGLCGGCIIGMLILWRCGATLRRRSRFAVAD